MSNSSYSIIMTGVCIALVIYIAIKTKLISSILAKLFTRDDLKAYTSKISELQSIIGGLQKDNILKEDELVLMRQGEKLLNIGFWSWDMAKDEVLCSRNFAEIFDTDPDEIIPAKVLMKIVHIDDKEGVNQAIERAFETGEPYKIEYRVVRRNDRHDLILATGQPIKNRNGKVTKIVGTVTLLKTDVD